MKFKLKPLQLQAAFSARTPFGVDPRVVPFLMRNVFEAAGQTTPKWVLLQIAYQEKRLARELAESGKAGPQLLSGPIPKLEFLSPARSVDLTRPFFLEGGTKLEPPSLIDLKALEPPGLKITGGTPVAGTVIGIDPGKDGVAVAVIAHEPPPVRPIVHWFRGEGRPAPLGQVDGLVACGLLAKDAEMTTILRPDRVHLYATCEKCREIAKTAPEAPPPPSAKLAAPSKWRKKLG